MPVAVSRPTVLVGVCIVLALLALLGQRLAHAGAASSEPEAAAVPLEPVAEEPADTIIVVHVVGEVRRPGLYRLRDGARIADAVHRAGGALRDADLAAVNLAAPLVDGVQILVPGKAVTAGAPTGGAGNGPGVATTGPVSLSSATLESSTRSPASAQSPRRRSSTTERSTGRSGPSTTSMPSPGSGRRESSSFGIS